MRKMNRRDVISLRSWKFHSMMRCLVPMLILAMDVNGARGQFAMSAPSNSIYVTGKAEVRVAPDEILIIGLVVKRTAKLDATAAQVDERVAGVLKFLHEAGVAPKDVQTDYVSVEPLYESRGSEQKLEPIGYEVRKRLVIRLRAMNKFDEVMMGIIRQGVNVVDGVEFRSTELRKHRDEARRQALKAAREKAELATAELGVKVGATRAILLDDSGARGYSWSWNSSVPAQGQNHIQSLDDGEPTSAEGAFSPGQISITASATVTFEIEQKTQNN